ncbi:DUF6767 domain-containing protein [Ornithinimicrobium sp. CNJ-824]|uniref:DUF6767 domain-containing protein n=1 Tax=Ornithinimicrobium sp. CNJ-824 TaxID=1904966 RepID=UPI0009F89555|nr:DUF6767 domain-containing protein [Ornithinimicrobium sp. CNJ-824]
MSSPARRRPVPRCPIRVGEPCTLCFPGATGPQDCGLVYLVQDDPEMAAELAGRRTAHRAAERDARGSLR